MKNFLLLLSTALLITIVSCSDNKETPAVDCSLSDLSLAVSGSTMPGCTTPGSIEVAASGGTSPYVYNIDNGDFQSSGVFNGLSSGTYAFTVMDTDGCTFSGNAELEAATGAIELSLVVEAAECGNAIGSITASATGGDGNYMFSINEGTPQASGVFTGLKNGSHTIQVTDGDGCSASRAQLVSSGIKWSTDIMPIINTNCAVTGCHNGDNGENRNWTVLANVQANSANVKAFTASRFMPQAGSGLTLTDAEIELIACWVDDGAQNN